MTPTEFAAQHGLSLEEAECVLARRNQPSSPPKPSRISKGAEVLAKAQKRVGVQPVRAEGGELVQEYDPDADVGLRQFYEKEKPRTPFTRPVVSAEDESQDPKDYR